MAGLDFRGDRGAAQSLLRAQHAVAIDLQRCIALRGADQPPTALAFSNRGALPHFCRGAGRLPRQLYGGRAG